MLNLTAVQAPLAHPPSIQDQASLGALARRPRRTGDATSARGRDGLDRGLGRTQNPGPCSAMALFTDLELAVDVGARAEPLTPLRRPCWFSDPSPKLPVGQGLEIALGQTSKESGCWLASASCGRLCKSGPQGRAGCRVSRPLGLPLPGQPALPPLKRGLWALPGVAAWAEGSHRGPAAEGSWPGARGRRAGGGHRSCHPGQDESDLSWGRASRTRTF